MWKGVRGGYSEGSSVGRRGGADVEKRDRGMEEGMGWVEERKEWRYAGMGSEWDAERRAVWR